MKVFTVVFLGLCFLGSLAAREPLGNEEGEKVKIGEEIASRHQVHFLLATGDDYLQWGLRFTSDRQLTLEEGEKLIAQMVADFIEHVSQNKYLDEAYIEPSRKQRGEYDFAQHPYDSRWFFVRLAFWDANVERPLSPYLAQIQVKDDKVLFQYADPKTQKLTKPIERSLPELLSLYGNLDK